MVEALKQMEFSPKRAAISVRQVGGFFYLSIVHQTHCFATLTCTACLKSLTDLPACTVCCSINQALEQAQDMAQKNYGIKDKNDLWVGKYSMRDFYKGQYPLFQFFTLLAHIILQCNHGYSIISCCERYKVFGVIRSLEGAI